MKQKIYIAFMFFFAMTSQGQATLSDYKVFAEETGNAIIEILADKTASIESRKKKFREVLTTRFSLPSIAKFALARYWGRANESQQERYISLFEKATIENYAAQFDSYNNERLEVVSVREGNKGTVIVITRILRPSGTDPLNVHWHVATSQSGQMKVVDLVINGVSMSITQRSEYSAMIGAAQGNLDRFLDTLEAQANASP